MRCYAFLRSQAPVPQPNRPHELRFPYDSQAALAVWRALFFCAGARSSRQASQPDAWNRGALPGARTRPLRRLPRAAQRLRRHARRRSSSAAG